MVWSGGVPWTCGVEGYLAYHLERTHPRELLMELPWPGAIPGLTCFDWLLVRTMEGAHIPREVEGESSGAGPRRE